MKSQYTALVSSDWNECLAPCGPFDVIGFHYPEQRSAIEKIFRLYTGNAATLGEASQHIAELLPDPITEKQMDEYLAAAFETYPGVSNFITACRRHGILFMINTTGMRGYFQRAIARGLLPSPEVLSAHPMVGFHENPAKAALFFPLLEVGDKAKNTAAAAERFNIPMDRIVLMGDSGGDGPHFEWGYQSGAHLIGCMVKPSLANFCHRHRIEIDTYFGHAYAEGETKDPDKEMDCDFSQLMDIVLGWLG